ncbi:helix-turn-helix domain-containing protein [Cupriavidus pauculus]|uniref:helix-turn-helix domain-containing protein n=1 Tax=Cupriavidus pauculus TaxID=82633 RepID=UPI001EE1BE05|nr:helix-turn-helix transcriptional regulator [Cupriavidus pauculus]GJG95380.1 helix-turn-helix transcriptional regulator [Cupriavidus pauculus]
MATTYPIRIQTQLSPVLQGLRKSRGLTQADVAARLGVTQQSYARLEANPARASMARVLAALQVLEVDLALTPRAAPNAKRGAAAKAGAVARTPKAVKAVKSAVKAAVKPASRRKPDPGPGEDW